MTTPNLVSESLAMLLALCEQEDHSPVQIRVQRRLLQSFVTLGADPDDPLMELFARTGSQDAFDELLLQVSRRMARNELF